MVDHALKALNAMARVARDRAKTTTIIAITGSVGKTSTKDILYRVLSHFGPTICAPASYNNQWGVPLTLSRLPRNAKYAILEIGMNHVGEIAPLSEMVRPHIAIITPIAPAHIGNMGTMDAIVREKVSILEGLEPDGSVILADHHPFFDILKAEALRKHPRYVFSFGEEPGADIRLEDFNQLNNQMIQGTVAIIDQKINFCLPLTGRHMALNSLCAFAVGRVLRLDYAKIAEALQTLSPLKNRCQVHDLHFLRKKTEINITLLDDSFNANLHSMTAGLETLLTLTPKGKGRRIAVVGEMLELGAFAIDHHQQISDFCAQKAIDLVFLCGGNAVKQGFSTLPAPKRGGQMESADELIPLVLGALRSDDIVLVKGSKGSKVGIVAEALLKMAILPSAISKE
jgi:UDP-N-acetylmuramoyl-tripeptide--D-alanyl-D-alanine ligase